MHTCPHCSVEIIIRELPHQGLFASFRVCPECNEKFTVDKKTKYRQALCIFLATISLVLTILLYFQGTQWLEASIISYVAVGILIYRGNKRLFYIPYEDD